MRIAYVGGDLFSTCAMVLAKHGHEIVRIYTGERDPNARRPTSIAAVASQLGCPISRTRLDRAELLRLSGEQIDLLFCAGYPWRIPVQDSDALRAVNLHPTLLPFGRGPSPFARIILDGLGETGVTVHEMVARFDAGPILIQERMPVHPNETFESLAFRSALLAERVTAALADSFEQAWEQRQAQATGSYWPLSRRSDRTLAWSLDVQSIDRIARAFGPRTIAPIQGKRWRFQRLEAWQEVHNRAPGTTVRRIGDSVLIAALDGFVVLGGLRSVRRRASTPRLIARAFAAAGRRTRVGWR